MPRAGETAGPCAKSLNERQRSLEEQHAAVIAPCPGGCSRSTADCAPHATQGAPFERRNNANAPFDTANGSIDTANALFATPNGPFDAANAAKDTANGPFDTANGPFNTANAAKNTANDPFGTANGTKNTASGPFDVGNVP